MVIGELEPGQEFIIIATGKKYRLTVHAAKYLISSPKVGSSWCMDMDTLQVEQLQRKTEIKLVEQAPAADVGNDL